MIEQGPHRPTGWRGQQCPAIYADLHELFALQALFDARVPGVVLREVLVRQVVVALGPSLQSHIAALREAMKTGGVPDEDLDHELALQLLILYTSACEDSCPVCLSADSDVEHYYLAPLLNSRRALRKLREMLVSALPQGDYLTALSDMLLAEKPVQVRANPGSLDSRLETGLGLGVVTEVDETRQVRGTSAVVVQHNHARDFLDDGDWKRRASHLGMSIVCRILVMTAIPASSILTSTCTSTACTWSTGAMTPRSTSSRGGSEGVYERLAAQHGIRVLHLEAGDVENDAFMGKVKTVIGDGDAEE